MHITTSDKDGITVVNVVGVLNIETEGAFKKRIRRLIEDGRSKILLDVSGIQSVDSSGIGVLVSLLNTARASGGNLKFACSFVPEVEEAFNLCGLLSSGVFKQFPDVNNGIQNFNP